MNKKKYLQGRVRWHEHQLSNPSIEGELKRIEEKTLSKVRIEITMLEIEEEEAKEKAENEDQEHDDLERRVSTEHDAMVLSAT